MSDDEQVSRACSVCGRPAEGSVVGWTLEIDRGVRNYLCPDCTREHVRSIEAQLGGSEF